MQTNSRSQDFLWLSIVLLPLISISFMFAIQPQDYWWVMRVGQETLQSGSIPVTDTISWSQFGVPIVYQPWLAGVIFWLIYKVGGISLTILMRGVLIGVTYGLLWFIVRENSNSKIASILVFIVGLASSNNWSVRTQLFAYPLFIFSLWSILRWHRGNSKYLWVLPLCTLLWVNLHGSFILPLILAGTAIVFGEGNKKKLFVAFLIMWLVTLINPRGFEVWHYFVFMLNSPSDQLFAKEWAPPHNVGWQMNIFFAWLLILAPLAARSVRKISTLEWIWFLGFGWLALSGLRYVIWFLFIITILTAKTAADLAEETGAPKNIFPALNISFGIFMLGLSIIFLPGIRERWIGDTVPVYSIKLTPLSATEWLAQHPDVCSNLWTDYAFGGYLSFALPSCKPWMDSRFNAYSADQWDEYVQVSNAENWQQMFDKNNINLLMLSTEEQPKLVEAVILSDAWCNEYQDEYAVIFSRCERQP